MRAASARRIVTVQNQWCCAPLVALWFVVAASTSWSPAYSHEPCREQPGCAGEPYAHMPDIAPIGVRSGKYLDIPESAKGPAIDPAKGYRLQELGKGFFMITDNAYQSMFMVYDRGVVVVDAPPPYAQHIRAAIAEVTDRPITHIVYSHSHIDHIGGPEVWAVDQLSSRMKKRNASLAKPRIQIGLFRRQHSRIGTP